MKPVSTNKHCLPFYDRPNGCRKQRKMPQLDESGLWDFLYRISGFQVVEQFLSKQIYLKHLQIMNLSNSWGSNHFYINVRFHKRNICLFESLQLLHVSLGFLFLELFNLHISIQNQQFHLFFRTPYSSLRELNESYFLGI